MGGAWQGVGGQENRGRGVEEERTGKGGKLEKKGKWWKRVESESSEKAVIIY